MSYKVILFLVGIKLLYDPILCQILCFVIKLKCYEEVFYKEYGFRNICIRRDGSILLYEIVV